MHPGRKRHTIEEWCMAGPRSLDGPEFITVEPLPREFNPGTTSTLDGGRMHISSVSLLTTWITKVLQRHFLIYSFYTGYTLTN